MSSCSPTRHFEIPKANEVDHKVINKIFSPKGEGHSIEPVISKNTFNPKNVLYDANQIAKTGDHTRAIILAEQNLPLELVYSANILRANAAVATGNYVQWLEYLNSYLAKFDIAPLQLEGEGSVFDRLASISLVPVAEGPLISVIMPAWNAEKTIQKSADSILNQTWRNIELIIVDDCSKDGTWASLQKIALADRRVRLIRNRINVGPYVSKNIALAKARGAWVTGHDADDWALPQRLERQYSCIKNDRNIKVSLSSCIRMDPVNGNITSIGKLSAKRHDGIAFPQAITALFEKSFFDTYIGYWDSSRFGADTELLNRARFILGKNFYESHSPGMFYMDTENSLTNNQETRFNAKGISPLRESYRAAWNYWHQNTMTRENIYCEFPPHIQRYKIPDGASVPLDRILACIEQQEIY
jgi:glycosyltransferase involved in cell wall biosynthesis